MPLDSNTGKKPAPEMRKHPAALDDTQKIANDLRSATLELDQKAAELLKANTELQRANQQLAREIKEREAAEQLATQQTLRLKAIIEAQPAWISICSTDGVVMDVNPAGVDLIEADTADHLLSRNLAEFVVPRYRTQFVQCMQSLVSGVPKRVEYEARTLKGNRRWLETQAVLVHNEQYSAQAYLLAITLDQSERRSAEKALAQKQHELAHIGRITSMGEMASGLAHELNQPLTAILNYASGCERRLSNERCQVSDLQEMFNKIAIQAQRASEIISQVRGYLRFGDQNQQTEDLALISSNALKLLAPTLPDHAEIIEQVSDGQALPVSANAVQIQQVLINLLQNALEATQNTREPAPKVTIAMGQHDHQAWVEVRDNGPGLPSTPTAEQLLEPFITTRENGIGMGLAISRSIVEAHGGQLSAANNDTASGAVFRFSLPLLNTPKL